MSNPKNTGDEIALIERKVLCSICQGAVEGSIREFAHRLRDYRWHDPTHEAVFQALMAIPSTCAAVIRAQLPSRLTRIGFPDVDWEWLFARPRLAKPEVEQLIRFLVEQEGNPVPPHGV